MDVLEPRTMDTDTRILATDLDGTLIPLDGNRRNQHDLRTLADQLGQHQVTVVYSTGRHRASVAQAMEQFDLPRPDWLICDVGTSLFVYDEAVGFTLVEAYQQHQDEIIARFPLDELQERVASVGGIRLQEPEKQGRFKLSFYADAARLADCVAEIQSRLDEADAPYSIIHSVDPFNGDGLIDLLPSGVSKAHALAWWVEHAEVRRDAIVFAGDSGNDLAALTAGYRAIVVGNADRSIAAAAYACHRRAGWQHRLFLAAEEATSGVLEGCRWFGLVDSPSEPMQPLPLGATPLTDRQTGFRVWAPRCRQVDVDVEQDGTRRRHPLQPEGDGHFSGIIDGVGPGARYGYRLDDTVTRPDPRSAYQPDGVHGLTEVIDQRSFPWTDRGWSGRSKRDLVIYELHVGAFTEAGTFLAAIERLDALVELGITAIELMPVTQTPGRWNWGYDGVNLFAVRNSYGTPNDLKALVDACHARGLAVILDVVYNHVGPEGNYLAEFGPYFSRRHHTPWGDAFNYDARGSRRDRSQHVRRFVLDNAVFWLAEYHLDGLRLDAVHFIHDDRETTMLDEIRIAVREFEQSAGRQVHLIAEANVYDGDLLQARRDRPAYDAIWCDCLMHSLYAHALPDLQLTHRNYSGAADVADALRYGYVYEVRDATNAVQRAEQRRGPAQAQVDSLVMGLQTHDSVGNHPHGKRLHQLTSKEFQRAAATLTLLYPGIPLLFMGEELAAESPFPFFADFEDPRLRRAVARGRAKEYPQHVWGDVMAPGDKRAFLAAKCHEPQHHDPEMAAWYRDLLALRKQGLAAGWLGGQHMTIRHEASVDLFELRYRDGSGNGVVVIARLNSEGGPEIAHVKAEGRLLLSSVPHPQADDGVLELRRNHGVVVDLH